jgi:hypothetical protein
MTKLKKGMALIKAGENGNELAQEYNQKIKDDKVSIDWAYKKVYKIGKIK